MSGTRALDDGWLAFSGRHADYASIVPQIDARMDKTLRGLRNSAQGMVETLPAGDPRHRAAARLLDECFPGGLGKLVNLPYVEQIAAVENLVKRLATDLAPLVQTAGLVAHVEQLGLVAQEYRQAVNLGKNEGFAPVREARRRGHLLMLEIVAIIIGLYHDSDSTEHMAARAELLAPLMEQLAIVKTRRRARRSSEDIDTDVDTTPDAEPDDDIDDVMLDMDTAAPARATAPTRDTDPGSAA